jgi:hypothetical protein
MSLDHIPAHRHARLLHRLTVELRLTNRTEPTREQVLANLGARAAEPCLVQQATAPPPHRKAVLGDDGRYHLRIGSVLSWPSTGFRTPVTESSADEGAHL